MTNERRNVNSITVSEFNDKTVRKKWKAGKREMCRRLHAENLLNPVCKILEISVVLVELYKRRYSTETCVRRREAECNLRQPTLVTVNCSKRLRQEKKNKYLSNVAVITGFKCQYLMKRSQSLLTNFTSHIIPHVSMYHFVYGSVRQREFSLQRVINFKTLVIALCERERESTRELRHSVTYVTRC